MADELLRDLERQAALGDSEAAIKLAAMRNRAGISSLVAEYYQEYLELTDTLVQRCNEANKRHEWEERPEDHDSEEEGFFFGGGLSEQRWAMRGILTKWKPKLTKLNKKYSKLGLEKKFLREEFPAQDAISLNGAWYNSSCY